MAVVETRLHKGITPIATPRQKQQGIHRYADPSLYTCRRRGVIGKVRVCSARPGNLETCLELLVQADIPRGLGGYRPYRDAPKGRGHGKQNQREDNHVKLGSNSGTHPALKMGHVHPWFALILPEVRSLFNDFRFFCRQNHSPQPPPTLSVWQFQAARLQLCQKKSESNICHKILYHKDLRK
jgi:hypothetical protein